MLLSVIPPCLHCKLLSSQVRGSRPDTLAYDNGGIPARSTCNTFNLLLLGVFQQAHLPGHTNPWLSVKCCKLTYPIHCNCKYGIEFINNITLLYTSVKRKKTLF